MEAELLRQEAAEVSKREPELELAHLGQEDLDDCPCNREDWAKAPKLPLFVDGKDNLDAYLQRFERFAVTAKWKKDGWASKLNALLSGRVYSRLLFKCIHVYQTKQLRIMTR